MKLGARSTWAALVVATMLGVAGCGSDDKSTSDSSATTSSGSDATGASTGNASSDTLKDPGSHTITVIPSTATSEFLGVSISQLKQVATPFGWTVQVCDGAGDVTKMERCVETAVTQKVSAIVTMALGGSEIQKGAMQAKAAGIPVIEYLLTPQPGFEKYFDAVFADDIVTLGKATGKWLAENRKNIPIVGEEITQNYGGQGYIDGLKEQLKAQGMKFTDLRDTDLANIVNSMTSNAQAIIDKNKGPLTFIDFSDFGTSVYLNVIVRAGRGKEVAVISRYDDPSTVERMRAGANIYVQVTRSYEHMFDMFDALLANFADKTPFPPASETVYEPGATVMGIEDFAEGSTEAYPFAPALKAKIAEWGKTYDLTN